MYWSPASPTPPSQPLPTATSGGSPGRLVAAFFIGAAITTVMAFAFALTSHVVTAGLGQILVLDALRLVSALLLGAVMALTFLIVKARGPLAPITAAIGALAAERAGTLAVGLVGIGTSEYAIRRQFHLSTSDATLYSALNLAAILLVPTLAGTLTAIFAMRKPKPSPTGPAPAGPYGPGQPALPPYGQPRI